MIIAQDLNLELIINEGEKKIIKSKYLKKVE